METSVTSVNHGLHPGATVNVVTKSGTNQFHGDAYGFLRSAALDARSYFDTGAPPPFHRSQYGGSVGGPIRKEKTFFFVDFDSFLPESDEDLLSLFDGFESDFVSDFDSLLLSLFDSLAGLSFSAAFL